MRVVRNYGASLLDYLNDDNSLQDVLSAGADESRLSEAAKKTLKENGITIGSSSSNAASSTQSATYKAIKESTESLRSDIVKLTNTGDDSLFSKAISSGNTADVVTTVTDFVDKYNSMVKSMTKMGGTGNTSYGKELAALVTKNKDALAAIGITANKDGTLSIDKTKLSAASASALQTAFNGDSKFAENVAGKSIYVEANAISAMYSSSTSNYTSSGSYSDSTLSSFLKSI